MIKESKEVDADPSAEDIDDGMDQDDNQQGLAVDEDEGKNKGEKKDLDHGGYALVAVQECKQGRRNETSSKYTCDTIAGPKEQVMDQVPSKYDLLADAGCQGQEEKMK